MKSETIKKLARNPYLAVKPLAARGFLDVLSDEKYLKLLFRAEMGRKLNLDCPQSFNEKIQWLKLHDRNPEYVDWVDKIKAKKKAGDCIGLSHVVPLVAIWDSAEDICFDKIPDVCVLKCNHDQGSTVIYRRGVSDESELCRFFSKRLKKSAFSETREWPYSQIHPKILCEKFLAEDIVDYKVFCFNNQPQIINIGQKSHTDGSTRITFLDTNWNALQFQRSDFERVKEVPPIPNCFEELISLAKKLSKGTRFVRTDFFVINNEIYFSEFTLYPTSGLIRFSPESADFEVGSWLKL